MLKHLLKITSLHDAQASCVCGWNYAFTGERSRSEIIDEYHKHLNWDKTIKLHNCMHYAVCIDCGRIL